ASRSCCEVARLAASRLQVAFLEKPLARLGVVRLIWKLPSQGISQAVVGIEQKRDVKRVANRFARHACREHRENRTRIELFRMQRERFEQAEHCTQLLVDRGRPIILEDGFHAAVTQREFRDRGVGLSSEDALIELRHERSECLALANGPGRWSAHDLLRELGESPAKEFLSIKERSQHTRCVAGHHSHNGEDRLFAEPMSPMNFRQPHAPPTALRPQNSRRRDAPSEALTTSSNIWSSPYFLCALAMSSSVTL